MHPVRADGVHKLRPPFPAEPQLQPADSVCTDLGVPVSAPLPACAPWGAQPGSMQPPPPADQGCYNTHNAWGTSPPSATRPHSHAPRLKLCNCTPSIPTRQS